MDSAGPLELVDYNLAVELDLFEAIRRGWLVPFQYFAIPDPQDYDEIVWKKTPYNEEELGEILQDDTRIQLITTNLRSKQPYAGKVKALAFCASVNHAKWSARRFENKSEFRALALTGDSTDEEREHAIQRIQDENDPLNIICTVGIFDEGVDIPALSHILFMAPTRSITKFLQRLDRGVRKYDNKHYVVILDFVGNFDNSFIINQALKGRPNEPLDLTTTQHDLAQFPNLPPGCYVDIDTRVIRLWETSLENKLKRRPKDRLHRDYRVLKEKLGHSPTLIEAYEHDLGKNA